MNEVTVKLFGKPVCTLHESRGRVIIKQIDGGAHFASPISIRKDQTEFETTDIEGFDGVPGFIHDALPGDFGNDIMNAFFKQKRNTAPTIAERLLFIGDRALGAVTFEPAQVPDAPDYYAQMRTLYEQGKHLKEGRADAVYDHLVAAAHSVGGGARAKAVVGLNLQTQEIFIGHRHGELPPGFIRAIVKYDETEEQRHLPYTKLEYIYSLLAGRAGIPMARTELMEAEGRWHFVTERFDNVDGKRLHIHSLSGLLHSNYRKPRLLDYDDLMRVAVRLGTPKDCRQILWQMLFNYMFVNQDDHSKNFSFLMDEKGRWRASPAYDLTYTNGRGMTVEHQMTVDRSLLSELDAAGLFDIAERYGILADEVIGKIKIMQALREDDLPRMMREYDIDTSKYDEVMKAVTSRTLKGDML